MRTNVDILLFARDMQSRRYMPTVAELAVIYRVHRRTICRWLDALEEAHWKMPARNKRGPRTYEAVA
jgi:DNA-binding transcriptional regulator YhcF (GntR family)